MVALVLCLGAATPVRADTAVLRNGRTLSITDFRSEGDRIVLVMDGGGEITLPNGQIMAIRREPAPATAPAALPEPDDALRLGPPPADATRLDAAPPGDEREIRILPGQVFDRAALRGLAARIARKHAVDETLIQAVIEVESRYDAFAVSPRGAMGLMQLMPRTAARFDVRNTFDPIQNVDGGVRYLKELLARYGGQVRLALAAYNAGEDAVDRFGGIPPYPETRQYVVQVLRLLPR
jgi:soluble lytic murein transglycosylase-like protein